MKSQVRLLAVFIVAVFSASIAAKPGDIHYVEPLQAEVYEEPSSAGDPKLVIAVGRKVLEFDRQNGWVNVGIDKSGGLEGWIRESDLSSSDPDGLKY